MTSSSTFRIGLIAATSRSHVNPGDVLICQGIRHLLDVACARQGLVPAYVQNDIFVYDTCHWGAFVDTVDLIVLCGTPQIDQSHVPQRFNQVFYDRLWSVKQKGRCKFANLYAGFVFQSPDAGFDKGVDWIVRSHEDFLRKNMNIYDLFVARDATTKAVMDRVGLPAHQLADSVSYSPDYYGQSSLEPAYDLLVLRHLGPGLNDRLIEAFNRLNGPGTVALCHDAEDYHVYKGRVPEPLLFTTDPRTLLRIYANAGTVYSLRTHGSVLAQRFGKPLLNIRMDSRAEILDYLGAHSITVHEFVDGHLKPAVGGSVQELLTADRERFCDLFRAFCV